MSLKLKLLKIFIEKNDGISCPAQVLSLGISCGVCPLRDDKVVNNYIHLQCCLNSINMLDRVDAARDMAKYELEKLMFLDVEELCTPKRNGKQ